MKKMFMLLCLELEEKIKIKCIRYIVAAIWMIPIAITMAVIWIKK